MRGDRYPHNHRSGSRQRNDREQQPTKTLETSTIHEGCKVVPGLSYRPKLCAAQRTRGPRQNTLPEDTAERRVNGGVGTANGLSQKITVVVRRRLRYFGASMTKNFSSWILALRPKTLTAALVPIVVATALVRATGNEIHWWISATALLASRGSILGGACIGSAIRLSPLSRPSCQRTERAARMRRQTSAKAIRLTRKSAARV